MIPLFPEYHKAQGLLKAIEGESIAVFNQMWSVIWNQRGTPQQPVDWKEPSQWIPERLSGPEAKLAMRIWENTGDVVNPRHIRGPQFLIDAYHLISYADDKIQLTQQGKDFVKYELGAVSKEIDKNEGCIRLLSIIALHNGGKRSTFYAEWEQWLLKNTNYKSRSVVNDSLTRRLRNLFKRGLISRQGHQYSITHKGDAYLKGFQSQENYTKLSEEKALIVEIDNFNVRQRETLYEQLKVMNPFQFERLIQDLLIAMGYEDVEVTSPTNDKGVDVVGTMQKGITTVKEVVQVKRNTKANIGRPVLDGLRGSLHRFDAYQGTIITLKGFTKGTRESAYESGGAPITLIDGETLMDLLFQYGIGVQSQTVKFFTVNLEDYQVDENELKE